jgi:hypothetical protein
MTNMDPKVTIDNHIEDKTDNQFEDKTWQEATASLQSSQYPANLERQESLVYAISPKSIILPRFEFQKQNRY